jgi:CHAD domain-containing protein
VLFIRTSRTVRAVLSDEGLVAEVDSDDVVTVDLETLQLSCWREVEIEEGGGSPAAVARLIQTLVQAGARPAAYPSKLSRGLRGDAPGRRVPRALEPIMVRIGAQVAALITREADVRERREDSIHQMRVASRRLRSCLRTFRPAFTTTPTSQLLIELKWLGGALGAARDAEVIAARVMRDVDLVAPENLLGPVASSLHARGVAEVAAAETALVGGLDSERYRSLLASLVNFTSEPPLSNDRRGRKWPERRVAKAIEKTDALVRHAYSVRPSERDAALHEARKSAKHVRYAAETLLPTDRRLTRTAKAYESIQETLGEHHDAVATRSLFRTEGARSGVRRGENGFAYGVLFAIEDVRAAKAMKKFEREWARLTAGGRRRIGA